MAAEIAEVIMKVESQYLLEIKFFLPESVTLLSTQVYSYTEQPEFALNQAAFEVKQL